MSFSSVAIGLSIMAMLSWGVGDFMIQKASRRLGDWETLFVITSFGAVVLLPFAWHGLPLLIHTPATFLILLCSAAFLAIAGLFQMESFKRGKISVVEPMLPFEIPAAAVLAAIVLGDRITTLQLWLIVALIIGIFLVSFRGRLLSLHYLTEKGVYFGLFGALVMGVGDFFLGWGSRVSDALTAYFVISIVMAVFSGIFLFSTGRLRKTFTDVKASRGLALAMAVIDNVAWVGYAFAMSIISIAVATGLAESSCIIGVFLGIFLNRERLQKHQKVGLIIALVSAIVLAFITT